MRKILFVLILLLLPSICVADESEQVIEKKESSNHQDYESGAVQGLY